MKSDGRSAGRRRKRRDEGEQLVLFKKRGGKRRGAGRPPKGTRAGAPHKERPFLLDDGGIDLLPRGAVSQAVSG